MYLKAVHMKSSSAILSFIIITICFSFHSGVDSGTPDHDRTMTSLGTSHHDSDEDALVKAR